MNAPDREESVILNDDEEVKIAYSIDSKILNSANFVIVKEDHTIGNLLRMKLLEDPNVRFAGYRNPHPLETLIEFKVRTNGEKDSLSAMKDSIGELLNEFNTLENRFKEARDRFLPENQFQDVDMMR
mmetsp:Transcript_7611/g.16596  ORF Transcript_7611/g.16596 Transcript_7611/m.16596 type:complete len:127 (-) Transcript_7611:2311-2691(-)|eukprot:CAMPEP_0203787878 /NCGR_PEP_ID=MMETSP0100_2-20121128/2497_1 /ASSEMBLY_ACC=CAM_ASM_000210 /TAXON_ID=96639 /ORGANISM=" , Strain NY0313808BC1" /LENGTH=126 /DNA_ID=CAMNT_0050690481 /DNA_START=15 /DNA_END=395 /DNA_ORIENTATION=+